VWGGPGKKGHLGKGISSHVVTYYSSIFSPLFLLGNPIRWGNFVFFFPVGPEIRFFVCFELPYSH